MVRAVDRLPPSATWTHSTRQSARLHLAVISKEVADACQSACRADVNLSFGHLERFFVQCDLKFDINTQQTRALQAMDQIPPVPDDEAAAIPWSVNVHSRADRVRHFSDATWEFYSDQNVLLESGSNVDPHSNRRSKAFSHQFCKLGSP